MVAEQKLSVAEAVRRLARRKNRLREWRTAVLAEGATAFRGSGQPRPADDELRRLRADIERPDRERDVLKQAPAFVAAPSK